jgi:hypothetical protein
VAHQGAFTVSVVIPQTEPEIAAIVVEPAATPVANPPGAIAATPVSEDFHVAEDVKTAVLPSL